MQLHSNRFNAGGNHRVWLYSVVFAGKLSVTAIMLLFLSFFVQPLHQAYANEAATEDVVEPSLPEEVAEQLPDVVEEVEEPEEVIQEVVEEEVSEEEVVDGVDTEESAEDSSEETNESATEEEKDSAETDSSTDGGTSSNDNEEPNVDTASSTEDSSDTSAGEETTDTATSTDEPGTGQETNTGTSSSTEETTNSTSTATSTGDGTSQSGGGGSNSVTDDSTGGEDDSNSDNDSSNDSTNDSSDSSDNNGGGGSSDDNATSSDDDLIDDEKIEEGVNDLVDEVVNEVVSLTRQLVTEENYFQFSKQSCVAVGDGTYHCTNKEQGSIDPDSAVYAEQDEGGDFEIYLRTSKGEVKQLSDNDYDDTSPDVDLASMRVVWQRLIDGRYQIISYDLEEREETQLTFSKNNSMEPKVSKEGITWQAWDGTDWEIMFFDGQYTEQITDNDGIQDVTPVVEDGYILWSVLGGEESEARVYSLESGERMTISGHEGGTVANPRFVLVYDTKFDNGDVVTVGFDPVTGLAQPVSAKAAELPFDIPEADPVGEIRALIQNKSSNEKRDVITVPTSDGDGELNLASTTATSSDTISIDPLDFDDNADLATTTEEVVELTEFDLVIANGTSSAPSEINQELIDVPDINEGAYIATTTEQ